MIMETIYGESPEIYKEEGYESNGGIALFSARNGGETITSSDQGGEQEVGGKILWTITKNDDGSITGGITGIDWCPGYTSDNPFLKMTKDEIWDIAYRDKNLDVIFNQIESPYAFADYVDETRHQCMSGNPW